MEKPYLLHLNQSCDLETTYEAIRSGFIALALEKNGSSLLFMLNQQTRCQDNILLTQKF